MLAQFDPVSFFYWIYVAIIATISYAIYRQQRKKASFEAQLPERPTVEQGQPFPVIFGTPPPLPGLMVFWWGDVEIGYKHRSGVRVAAFYYAGMLLGACRSGVDGLVQLWYDGRIVWPNSDDETELAADGVTYAYVDCENILGGYKARGGIMGRFWPCYGASDQQPNSYLQSQLGADIPAHRNIVTIACRAYWGTMPQFPVLAARFRATDHLTDGSAQWYPAKADINGGLNPAHMVRQALTDDSWGDGQDAGNMGTSFTTVADALYTEGCGLHHVYTPGPGRLKDLIDVIQEHIAGYTWEDHTTGKVEIGLMRDDYEIGSLESFDRGDFEIVKFFRPGYRDVPGKVTVLFTNWRNGERIPASYDDAAIIAKQGGRIVEQEIDLPMIQEPELAGKAAVRIGRTLMHMGAQMTLKAKRTMSHLHRGSVVKIGYADDDLAITQMVIRVLSVRRGQPGTETVTLEVMEDVYKATYTVYGGAPGTTWTDPVHDAQDVAFYVLMEAPYWTLYRDVYGAAALAALGADAGILQVGAVKPTPDHIDYDLLVRDTATSDWYDERADIAFVPTAVLAEDVAQGAADIEVEVGATGELVLVDVDTYALIGDELVAVLALDTDNYTVTLARGVLDSPPTLHAAGARILFLESALVTAAREYTAGDTPAVKFLTSTARDLLDADEATARTAAAFASRKECPYPPGNFKVDAVSYPVSFTGDVDLSWSHRDRTDAAQLDAFVKQDSATDYGPEAGTTYTVRVYDQANRLVRTATGISGKTYTYTEAFERADCGLSSTDPLNTRLRFAVVAVRGGYESYRAQDITVSRWQAHRGVVGYEDQMISHGDDVVVYEYRPTNELYFWEDEPVCYEDELVAEGTEWDNVVCHGDDPVFYEDELVWT